MPTPSPNRPPRAKRPPEVARHVTQTIDAYWRMVESRKKPEEARPTPVPPDKT